MIINCWWRGWIGNIIIVGRFVVVYGQAGILVRDILNFFITVLTFQLFKFKFQIIAAMIGSQWLQLHVRQFSRLSISQQFHFVVWKHSTPIRVPSFAWLEIFPPRLALGMWAWTFLQNLRIFSTDGLFPHKISNRSYFRLHFSFWASFLYSLQCLWLLPEAAV